MKKILLFMVIIIGLFEVFFTLNSVTISHSELTNIFCSLSCAGLLVLMFKSLFTLIKF